MQEADPGGVVSRAVAGGPIADVVFVLGAPGSGLTGVRDTLAGAGLRPLDAPRPGATGPSELSALQGRLLDALGGTLSDPPGLTAATTVRLLEPFEAEARSVVATCTSRLDSPASPTAPWVWADPRLALLAPFWAGVTGGRYGAVLVWRPPARMQNDGGGGKPVPNLALTAWCRYNRAAIANCLEWPSMVVRGATAGVEPDAVLRALPDLIRGMGLSSLPTTDAPGTARPGDDAGVGARPDVSPVVVSTADGDGGDPGVALLVGVLDELEGVHGPGSNT